MCFQLTLASFVAALDEPRCGFQVVKVDTKRAYIMLCQNNTERDMVRR